MAKREEDILIWLIVLLLFLLMISSCNTTARPEYFNNKLNNIHKMNNQLGATIGYNTHKFNSPMYLNERLYQQFNGIPNNQLNFQTFQKIKSKYDL